MNNQIKQDINFLEHPLWLQSESSKMTDIEGYTYEAAGGVPSKVDVIFLYYFLLKAQEQNWPQTLILSRYEILKACDITPSKKKYDRIEESLYKWRRVHVSFAGTFYTGKVYSFMEFGIVDYYGFSETDKKIEVRLSPEWLTKIRESEFFKYISFSHMKHLRSPLALRLYEILGKTFYKRNTWEIDILKLAAKIPMAEKYIAHIIPKIEAATKRIRDKTDLDITVKVVKQDRGQGKFIFTKKEKKGKPEAKESSCELLSLPEPPQSVLKTPQPQLKLPPPSEPPPSLTIEIINLIPEEWRDSVIDEVNRIYAESDADTIKRCIEKVNISLNKGTELSSYGGYLRRCYDEKWYNQKSASQIKADKQALESQKVALLRKKENEERIKREKLDKLKHNFDEELSLLAVGRFKEKSLTEQAKLIKEFEDSMNTVTKDMYIKAKKNIEASIFVRSAYHSFLKSKFVTEDERNFEMWLVSRAL
mgnify:CR=1 FL=1